MINLWPKLSQILSLSTKYTLRISIYTLHSYQLLPSCILLMCKLTSIFNDEFKAHLRDMKE